MLTLGDRGLIPFVPNIVFDRFLNSGKSIALSSPSVCYFLIQISQDLSCVFTCGGLPLSGNLYGDDHPGKHMQALNKGYNHREVLSFEQFNSEFLLKKYKDCLPLVGRCDGQI